MWRSHLLGLIALAFSIGVVAAQEKPPAPKTGPSKPAQKIRPDLVPGYKIQTIEGFNVLLSAETLKNNDSTEFKRKPLEVLELELKTIAGLFPAKTLNLLRNVAIWVEWDEALRMPNGRTGTVIAVYYGGHQRDLLAKGKHPLKAKNVTILRMKSLTAMHQPARDLGGCVILHEIAHAVQDQVLGDENAAIKATYKQAMERKLYDREMYASTSEHEFFAELTCAYFDQLEYYPRTRADLKKHDPATHKLLETIWGKGKPKPAIAGKGPAELPSLRLETIDLGRPVLGPKVNGADLKGRAVALVLWNAGSDSSLGCLAKVIAWDAELSNFGLATVAVHLTAKTNKDIDGAARSRGVAFAVTEQAWVDQGLGALVDDFNDFPQCLVFDHAGQCVYRGSPFDAESAVQVAVGNALVAAAGGETLPKSLTPVMDTLRQGKSPSSVLSRLAPLTRSTDAETAEAAKRLVGAITEAGRKVLQQAEPLVTTDPAGAFLLLERLPVIFKDTAVAVSANEQLARLKTNKAVQAELRARPSLAAIRKIDTELSGRPGSFEPGQQSFRKDNAVLLQKLQVAVLQMKKSSPSTKATEQAVAIAQKYALTVR